MSNKEFSLYLVPKVSSICDEIVNYYKVSYKKQGKYSIIQNYIQCLKMKIQKCGILVILCCLIC